ncbi:MAG: hypothetical protein AAF517_02090, partial [Planctomycetota bacterium]
MPAAISSYGIFSATTTEATLSTMSSTTSHIDIGAHQYGILNQMTDVNLLAILKGSSNTIAIVHLM